MTDITADNAARVLEACYRRYAGDTGPWAALDLPPPRTLGDIWRVQGKAYAALPDNQRRRHDRASLRADRYFGSACRSGHAPRVIAPHMQVTVADVTGRA